jgi:hypothetical protein
MGPQGPQGNSFIGGPVGGGAAKSVLFVDTGGVLAQDTTGLNFDSTTNLLTAGGLSVVNSRLTVANLAANGPTTVNWANGEVQRVTLTGAATIAVSNWPPTGVLAKLALFITNNGAYNITGWPAGTIWAGGTAPTITSGSGKRDIILLMTPDGGTTVYGSIAGQDYH